MGISLAEHLSSLRRWWRDLGRVDRYVASGMILVMVGYLVHLLPYSAFYIEDSGISFAFSRNLAEGHGLVPYVGSEPVEGFSNPSWTFLIALFHLVGIPVWTSAKLLAGVLGCLTLVAAALITRRCLPDRHDATPLLPAALLAAHTPWVIWNSSGLENSLFNCFLAWGVYRILVEVESPERHPWSAALFFGLAVTRPEGILYAAIGGFAFLAGGVKQGAGLLPSLRWIAVFWVPFLIWQLWRYQYFGWEFPNTYYAKLDGEARFKPFGWERLGWRYATRYGQAYFLIPALPLLGLGLTRLQPRGRWVLGGFTLLCSVLFLWDGRDGFDTELRPEFWDWVLDHWNHMRVWSLVGAVLACLLMTLRMAGALPRALLTGLLAGGLFFIVYSGGDWMKQWRWFNLIALPLFILLSLGIVELARGLSGQRKAGTAAMTLVLALLLGLPNIWNGIHAAPSPETTVSDVHRRVQYMKGVQKKLHLDHVTLLDVDMGAHMWYTDWYIADIAGLIDVSMARHLYQRDFIRQYLYEERKPHFAHVHAGWASKSKIHTHPQWKQQYIEIPGYPIGRLNLHVGNHIRKDIFVESSYGGPKGREQRFDKGLILEGWEIPSDRVPQGGKLYLETWLRMGFKKKDFRMLVLLEDDQGNLHTQALPPGYGWYLPSKWKTHEHVRHRQDFELPEDLPPGTYDLGYLFIDEESGEILLPKNLDPEAPARGVQGSVWFPNAVEITTRAQATEEAEADRKRALSLAEQGSCEEAWEAWRQARWHIFRNLAWHERFQPKVETAVAGCWARGAAEASREEAVDRLERARRFDLYHPEIPEQAQPWLELLRAEADEASQEEDWKKAYAAARDMLLMDPNQPQLRREAEAWRDLSLDIEGKVSDRDRSKRDREEKKAQKEKEKLEKGEAAESDERSKRGKRGGKSGPALQSERERAEEPSEEEGEPSERKRPNPRDIESMRKMNKERLEALRKRLPPGEGPEGEEPGGEAP